MLKQKYFLTDFFILSAEKQPIKLSWRNIEWLPEKLLVFENGRQYVIYSKKNEPRLSVVGAFICCLTFDCLNNIGLFVSIFVR